MHWTDAAIEDLKRLALEGRSASVIAAAIGAPSRNAVIGKASRIGIKLNGDGRGQARGRRQGGAQRMQTAAPLAKPVPAAPSLPSARTPDPEAWLQEGEATRTSAEIEIGEMRRLRFDEIREPACRWPIGDPRSGDFVYCGLERAGGHSYCPGHRRMAYRSPHMGGAREPRRSLANSWRLA